MVTISRNILKKCNNLRKSEWNFMKFVVREFYHNLSAYNEANRLIPASRRELYGKDNLISKGF